jgi:hypothetical protein
VTLVLLLLASWAGSTYTAHALGTRKDRYNCWLWGFLIGWIGVIVVACLKPRYEKRNKRPQGEDRRWAEPVRQQAELDRQQRAR